MGECANEDCKGKIGKRVVYSNGKRYCSHACAEPARMDSDPPRKRGPLGGVWMSMEDRISPRPFLAEDDLRGE